MGVWSLAIYIVIQEIFIIMQFSLLSSVQKKQIQNKFLLYNYSWDYKYPSNTSTHTYAHTNTEAEEHVTIWGDNNLMKETIIQLITV